MDTLRLDVLYAIRGWRRYPVATAAAIVALALGIGATTAVSGFVSAVILRPLPYADPDRIVMMWQDRSSTGGPARELISPGLWVDWSRRATAVTGVTAIRPWSPTLTGAGSSGNDEAERLTGAAVTAGYFSTLGVAPALGRTFTAEDDVPGASPVIVISNGLWTRRFGADPGIIGRPVELDGQATTVIGVMPSSFKPAIVDAADAWTTLRIDPANAPHGAIMLQAFGRLAPGVSFDQAQSALTALQAKLQMEDVELRRSRARIIRLKDDLVGPVRSPLTILGGGVSMVLLIACANVAGLLLARSAERRNELAVRVALGADRWRLARQLLTESALLACAGSALGLAVAYGGMVWAKAAAPPQSPRLEAVHLSGGLLVFMAAIAATAALAAGLAPALAAARAVPAGGLKSGGRGEAGGSTRGRAWLVGVEVATAMTLLVGAGLFVRTLVNLQRVDLGFRPGGLMTASIAPPRGTYASSASTRALFDSVIARAAALPGVERAAFTSVLPLSGAQIRFNFRIVGRPPERDPNDAPVASFRSVSPEYFETMGMRIVEGRSFSPEDAVTGPTVVVVNQALARKYWPGQSPVGVRLGISGNDATIIGVVADIHHAGPGAVPDGELYVRYSQFAARLGWLVVRGGDPSALAPALRAAVREIDPNLPLAQVRTMPSLVASNIAQPRFLATLLSVFSGIAAALAVIGIYGLLSFAVAQRTREIGLRAALGASRASILAGVLRQSMAVTLAGVTAGALAGALLSRLMRALLFEITPGDPVTVAGVAALIVVASLAASLIPAGRAAAIDPLSALRDD